MLNNGFVLHKRRKRSLNSEVAASERPTWRGSQYPNQLPLRSGDSFSSATEIFLGIIPRNSGESRRKITQTMRRTTWQGESEVRSWLPTDESSKICCSCKGIDDQISSVFRLNNNMKSCKLWSWCDLVFCIPSMQRIRTLFDSTKLLLGIALAGDRRLDALHGAGDEAVHCRHRPQGELGCGDGVDQYLERHRQEWSTWADATIALHVAACRAVRQDGKARG